MVVDDIFRPDISSGACLLLLYVTFDSEKVLPPCVEIGIPRIGMLSVPDIDGRKRGFKPDRVVQVGCGCY